MTIAHVLIGAALIAILLLAVCLVCVIYVFKKAVDMSDKLSRELWNEDFSTPTLPRSRAKRSERVK